MAASLPKIELHAHLNGSLTIETIQKLIRLSNDPSISVPKMLECPSSMEEVFKLFPLIQAVTSNYELVKQATVDVIKDFARENTVYLELRTTPKDRSAFSKEKYVQAVLDGIKDCSDLSIVVRLLLSIDRRQTVEQARETVGMVKNDKSGLIVGIDLSGDPSVDGRKFIPVLEEAQRMGIKLAVHLAEIETCLDEVDDFLTLGPDRIGHGTFLHKEDLWVQKILEKQIPFEICLTSNVMSMTTKTAADSHFGFWSQKGLPVAVCTDDSGLMGTTLTKEYDLAVSTFNVDIRKIAQDSLQMSFVEKNCPDYQKVKQIISQ